MRTLAILIALQGACAANPPAAPAVEVLLFITVDCPIANAFAPEINRIVADYRPRGVEFTLVYTDLTRTPEEVGRHVREYGFAASAARDEGRRLSGLHGATVTPEAVVLARGARVYRGRIDDRYLAPGRYRLAPTTRDLRDAIESALAGRPVLTSETAAVGCPITN